MYLYFPIRFLRRLQYTAIDSMQGLANREGISRSTKNGDQSFPCAIEHLLRADDQRKMHKTQFAFYCNRQPSDLGEAQLGGSRILDIIEVYFAETESTAEARS